MKISSKLFLIPAMVAGMFLADGARADDIPNLVGTWSGLNKTISQEKGLREWDKTIHITEQTGRRFKGNFTYSEGKKAFVGVIYPDNKSFTWVSSNSMGYNQGRILDDDRISACYVEAGKGSTAGCAEMSRKK